MIIMLSILSFSALVGGIHFANVKYAGNESESCMVIDPMIGDE